MNLVNLKRVFFMCFATIVVTTMSTGCATDIGGKSYSDESVGETAQTFSGVVIKVRGVKVAPDELDKSRIGIIGGGVGGALIGSQISSGLGGAIATIGLAGAGALGGAAAEKSLRTQKGFEITLKLSTGELRTVVQGVDVNFKKGEHVLLMIYQHGRCKVAKEDDDVTDDNGPVAQK